MNLIISEVQITFVILMGMITFFLAFVIDRYTVVGKMFGHARRILTMGTLLVSVHFMVQYWIHKSAIADETIVRTLVNLSFGIPISYFFNMSNYYLLRKGKVDWVNWFIGPVAFLLSMTTLAVCMQTDQTDLAATLMSIIYAFTLIHYGVLQIREYFKVVKKIKLKEDFSLLPYIKWTQWSLIFMIIIAFGFPIMTFNTNLLMRSLYGLLSIIAGFYYLLSFMGYGINGNVSQKYADNHGLRSVPKPNSERTNLEEEYKMENLRRAMTKFVAEGGYLRNGITQKEAAEEMRVPTTRLRMWLKNSEFETFNRWLLYLRLTKAKEMLLADPDMGGDELAEKCGFCDRQYLQRTFRKWTGMTPTQWVKHELHKTLGIDGAENTEVTPIKKKTNSTEV